MSRGREELRRGIREVIEHASQEMDALAGAPQPRPAESPKEIRPILRLVREPAPQPSRGAGADVAPATPAPEITLPDMPEILPKKGVCGAYLVNKHCWELPDAYCNTALHVCMTRECPVYHLYKEELERRFAAKFAHFW